MKREGGGVRDRWARRILGLLFEPDEVEEILRDLDELTRDHRGRGRALAFWTMLCAYPLHEGRERVQAWVDDRREGRTMGRMIEDVGFAWRGLRRRPAFALMALLILSVGFGSVVAVHSVVKGGPAGSPADPRAGPGDDPLARGRAGRAWPDVAGTRAGTCLPRAM